MFFNVLSCINKHSSLLQTNTKFYSVLFQILGNGSLNQLEILVHEFGVQIYYKKDSGTIWLLCSIELC